MFSNLLTIRGLVPSQHFIFIYFTQAPQMVKNWPLGRDTNHVHADTWGIYVAFLWLIVRGYDDS